MNGRILIEFKAMLDDRIAKLEGLHRWKDAGGDLKNFPKNETLDDLISREEQAVENLQSTNDHLQAFFS